jgi:hypothetical protein
MQGSALAPSATWAAQLYGTDSGSGESVPYTSVPLRKKRDTSVLSLITIAIT